MHFSEQIQQDNPSQQSNRPSRSSRSAPPPTHPWAARRFLPRQSLLSSPQPSSQPSSQTSSQTQPSLPPLSSSSTPQLPTQPHPQIPSLSHFLALPDRLMSSEPPPPPPEPDSTLQAPTSQDSSLGAFPSAEADLYLNLMLTSEEPQETEQNEAQQNEAEQNEPYHLPQSRSYREMAPIRHHRRRMPPRILDQSTEPQTSTLQDMMQDRIPQLPTAQLPMAQLPTALSYRDIFGDSTTSMDESE